MQKLVKTQKSTNNLMSSFGLIKENMELSHINLGSCTNCTLRIGADSGFDWIRCCESMLCRLNFARFYIETRFCFVFSAVMPPEEECMELGHNSEDSSQGF